MADRAAGRDRSPFADLPAALIEEVFDQTSGVARDLLASLQKLRVDRDGLRERLLQTDLLVSESSLGYPPLPTTCAADGSYAIERLLTTDLAVAAAVAVEGLTPPSEKRHWEHPHHTAFVAAEPHFEDTATVLRALMLGEELTLAATAPHEVVMLDGTLTLPVIYFNQALAKVPQAGALKSCKVFVEKSIEYLEAYLAVLTAKRSDKQYVALPKYSTRREVGRKVGWDPCYDDRGLLTLLLNPGELTRPHPLEQPRDAEGNLTWHLHTSSLPPGLGPRATDIARAVVAALGSVHVFYYKPHPWLPALRVEVSSAVAANSPRLALVVQALKHQSATPSMLEPYPIYLADRTAKALSRAVPAFRQVATQRISEEYPGDIGEVFFAMHSYRSDIGR